jgi:soluble lytic murein transglycosylase-like protein
MNIRSLISASGIAGVVCALLLPGVAQAKVSLVVGAEGRKVIFNEGTEVRARRLADRMVPFPSADLEPLIDHHSANQNLDPKLVRAVVQVESGYNHRARSNKGAIGLMQLIPATARLLAVDDPYDPDQNIRGGTTYLRRMIDRFNGSIEMALAAYNAGPEAVARYNGIPPYRETLDYVRRILSLYRGTAVPVTAAAGLVASPVRQAPRGAKPIMIRQNGRLVITTLAEL